MNQTGHNPSEQDLQRSGESFIHLELKMEHKKDYMKGERKEATGLQDS